MTSGRGLPVTINGKPYFAPLPLIVDYDVWGVKIRTDPPQQRLVNECKACGRFDLEPVSAHSIEQAIEFGWLEPVDP